MTMLKVMREVTWGEALLVEASKFSRGLQGVVDVIRAEVGPHIGSRNTFAKLFQVTNPERLSATDAYRAWLLLVTLELDPGDWGISNDVVPRAHNSLALSLELMHNARLARRGQVVDPEGRDRSWKRQADAPSSDGDSTRQYIRIDSLTGRLRKPAICRFAQEAA